MKKLILLLMGLFVFSNLVYSLDCKYTQMEEYQIEENQFYLDGELLDEGPTYEYQNTGLTTATFKVYNPYDFDINIEIPYKTKSSWYGDGTGGISGTVLAGEIKVFDSQHNTGGPVSEPILKIIEPEITQKHELVTKEREICKLCNDKECLNDGSSCSSSNECGGGYCINGVCSNSEVCFDNNCKCSSDEIQCNDNKRCVKKSVIPIDVKPECNKPQECITGYINSETGLCEKSPAQIQEEENQKLKEELVRKEKEKRFLINAILGLAFIVIFGIGTIWYLKNKHEKEKQKTIETKTNSDIKVEEAKQKTIQKEIELEGRKIQRKEYELNELKEQIKEIERQKNKTQQEIKELKNLKSKREDLIADIENQYDKITKPFPDSQASNRLVVINPHLGGYKCFYKRGLELEEYHTSSLVHRWVWKKHNGRYPRRGYHIHHIDEDKYNNDPRNLEEIEGGEHYKKHRGK